jgi:hypothetical protein
LTTFFAFVFLFFAIAALLALSGWRHRYSAVANRRALHSDYYSRKKITVTPLNFVCKCRALPLRCKRDSERRKIESTLNRFSMHARAKFSAQCGSAHKMRVSTSFAAERFASSCAYQTTRARALRTRDNGRDDGFTTVK